MKIGDVSRSRRFANPARLRWYAFHRSVRFALRMMKGEESPSPFEVVHLQVIDLPLEMIQSPEPAPSPDLNDESVDLEAGSPCFWPSAEDPVEPRHDVPGESS